MTQTSEVETKQSDEKRERLLAQFQGFLGESLIESHIKPGSDLWIRIDRSRWASCARFAKEDLGLTWLDFVSAIDWLPSPFGREMEAEQDWVVHGREEKELPEQTSGYAGGDSRFQAMLRVYSCEDHIGVTIKSDLDDENPSIETLIPVFPGANWHEREMWEMFGIHISAHPDLRVLYLPSGFEGNPLRKDFPLVARRVKPWPGIVDVEPMPDEEEG